MTGSKSNLCCWCKIQNLGCLYVTTAICTLSTVLSHVMNSAIKFITECRDVSFVILIIVLTPAAPGCCSSNFRDGCKNTKSRCGRIRCMGPPLTFCRHQEYHGQSRKQIWFRLFASLLSTVHASLLFLYS